MGFKSVIKKIGKVALTAAPYVAAPFTGGASLMATGLANKAVQKWSEHDAKDAIAHGLAPSKFDSVLGKVGGVAGLASSFIPTNALGAVGLLGNAAKAGNVAKNVGTAAKVGGILSKAAKVATPAIAGIGAINALRGSGGSSQDQVGQNTGSALGNAVTRSGAMPRGGFRYSENPMNQYDQSSPNLATSIFQGRQEAIKNQPFRKGYDVTTRVGEPDEEGKYETRVTKMPRITSGRPDVRKPRGWSSQQNPEEPTPVSVRAKRRTPREVAY